MKLNGLFRLIMFFFLFSIGNLFCSDVFLIVKPLLSDTWKAVLYLNPPGI